MWSAADRLAVSLAAIYLAVALHGLGAADIVGDDEAREAGLVQEVVAGNWLWPRFNGEVLPDKPLLYHWLAAVPCAAFGFSETAVRLPAALAGAALVGWTARFGSALLGLPAGAVAAGLLATMPALFSRARVARPDTLLVLLLSLSLGSAFRWWRDARPREATLALLFLGTATLAKGPVAPVLFGLTVLGFLAWQGELYRLRAFVTPVGVAGFLLLGLGWYAVALGGWGDLFVREHLVGRYLRNLAGGLASGGSYSPRPLTYHLAFYAQHLPAVALPWAPFTALAIWQAWRTGTLHDPRCRFLVCWAVAPLVAFTPAEWKLRHYLLPALPPLALLTAAAVQDRWGQPARSPGSSVLTLVAVPGAALVALAVWAAASGRITLAASDRTTVDALVALLPGHAAGAAAGAGLVAAVLMVAVARRAWRPLIVTLASGTVAWMVVGAPFVERAVSERDSLKGFAGQVSTRFPPPAPLAFFEQPIRSLVVYLGRHVPTLARRREITPGRPVIVAGPAYSRLAAAGVLGPPLVTAEGRVGNLAHARVMLAEGLPLSPAGEACRVARPVP